jgi:hypothetical protein
MYIIHSARWWKCYFPDPNEREEEEKLPFARRATSQFPHFPHEMFLCLSYVFIYVGFFLFCCLGFHLNGLNKKKSLLSNFFSARILSIFPAAMRYVVSVPFRFPRKTVMDFCVGYFWILTSITSPTLGLVFVYLCHWIFNFFYQFRVSKAFDGEETL